MYHIFPMSGIAEHMHYFCEACPCLKTAMDNLLFLKYGLKGNASFYVKIMGFCLTFMWTHQLQGLKVRRSQFSTKLICTNLGKSSLIIHTKN